MNPLWCIKKPRSYLKIVADDCDSLHRLISKECSSVDVDVRSI